MPSLPFGDPIGTDFSTFEIVTVQANVDARWGRDKVELILADVGLHDAASDELESVFGLKPGTDFGKVV